MIYVNGDNLNQHFSVLEIEFANKHFPVFELYTLFNGCLYGSQPSER